MQRTLMSECSDALAPGWGAPACQRAVLICDRAGDVLTAHARLIHEARLRGHEVFCFAPRDEAAFQMLRLLGVEPMNLPTSGRDKLDIRELALALSSLTPDVLVALSWPAGRLGVAAGARAQVGRIVAAFPEVAQALAPNCADARLRRECAALLSRCDAAIVPGLGRDPVVDGRSLMPPALEPVFVAGHGVDLSHVAHVPLAPLTRGMVFLAIAWPGGTAGIELYCESARRLHRRGGGAIYLVASPPGEEPREELLRLMKAHRGIVRYLGPREDIERLLARAHAVVFPGQTPCLPAEIGHALAIGRPLISADVPARWQAVQTGVNGQRVTPGDVEALTDAMAKLLRRPDLVPRYAKESRRIATTQFDIEAVVAAQLQAMGL